MGGFSMNDHVRLINNKNNSLNNKILLKGKGLPLLRCDHLLVESTAPRPPTAVVRESLIATVAALLRGKVEHTTRA